MNKVIISGASGFVGLNLVPYLKKRSFEILKLSRNRNNPETLTYEELSVKALNETSIFIHLAGKAHDVKGTADEEEYFQVNTELTKKLFDLFLKSECETFIYLSSVKAVADEVSSVLLEDVIPKPRTAYGRSKRAAEVFILSRHLPNTKKVFILRPTMIHGPGNKGNLNLLYKMVSKGLPWPLGDFKNNRSFLSINNLCFVIKELIENETIPSGIYHIADDKSISTNELIQLLGSSLNRKSTIFNVPSSLIRRLAKVGDYFKLPLNSERLQKLTENYVVSNKKIVSAIGKPLPVTAEEGLLQTFKSFKNNNDIY